MKKKYIDELDEIFEDMNSYTGPKLHEDELFDRVLEFLTSHNTELISKIEGMRKELWLDYHNAQKWSEQKAVAEALDQVISLINQEK